MLPSENYETDSEGHEILHRFGYEWKRPLSRASLNRKDFLLRNERGRNRQNDDT